MKEIYFEQIDSTNLYGKLHLGELPDKTVIYAKNQTEGRGRLSRRWVDLGGDNLFLSFILKPSNSFSERYSNLSQYLSVILCKVLESYNVMPEIKWPNDVLINGKKIAGILAETVTKGDQLKGIVLGIGVNLNADAGALKLVTDKQITALNVETARFIDVANFRKLLCTTFFNDYEKFMSQGFAMLHDYYSSHACFLDKEVTIQIFDKKLNGIAKNITNKGELQLFDGKDNLIINIGDILS